MMRKHNLDPCKSPVPFSPVVGCREKRSLISCRKLDQSVHNFYDKGSLATQSLEAWCGGGNMYGGRSGFSMLVNQDSCKSNQPENM
jgi:hypothetical protein